MTENYCFIGQNWCRKNLIRHDEFRKNAVKILRWKLWELDYSAIEKRPTNE